MLPSTCSDFISNRSALYGSANQTSPASIPTSQTLLKGAILGDMEAMVEVVAAFMDGFRLSSAAAQGNKIKYLQRKVPKWIWALVETILVAEGFFNGPPEGNFGPEARAALNKWIVAKGPLPAE